MEGDDGVVGFVFGEGGLDHLEEGVGFFDAVDDHFSGKVPVAGVFGVGLAHVEAFYVGGVSAQFFLCGGDGGVDFGDVF